MRQLYGHLVAEPINLIEGLYLLLFEAPGHAHYETMWSAVW